jgi:hypothetical protein
MVAGGPFFLTLEAEVNIVNVVLQHLILNVFGV